MKDDPQRGERIREARKSKFRSQQALADAMKLRGARVTRGAVNNWERGQGAEGDNIALVADLTGYSVNYLWTGKEPKTHEPPDTEAGERLRLIQGAYPDLLHKIGIVNPFTWTALIEGLQNITPHLARSVALATDLPESYVQSGIKSELTLEQALKLVPGSRDQSSSSEDDSRSRGPAARPAHRSAVRKQS